MEMKQKSLEGENDNDTIYMIYDMILVEIFSKQNKTLSLPGRGPVGGHCCRGRGGGAKVPKSLPDLFANQERDEEGQQQDRGSGDTGCCHAGDQLSTRLHQDTVNNTHFIITNCGDCQNCQIGNNKVGPQVGWHFLFILLRNNNNSPGVGPGCCSTFFLVLLN